MSAIWHWLLAVTGVSNPAGKWYAFWSGFGANFAEFAIVGALYRNVNCHQKGCWRPGHHVNGTVVCHRHRLKPPPASAG